MELLAEQINAQGGVNGHPIELVIYDTEGDATKAVLNAQQADRKGQCSGHSGPLTEWHNPGCSSDRGKGPGAAHFLRSFGENHHPS